MPSVPVIRRAKRKGDPDIYYVPPLDRRPPRPRRPSQTPTGFGGGILPEGDFKRLAAQDRDHPIIARARRYARYLQNPHFYHDRQGRRHSIKQPPQEAATHAATNPVQDRDKASHKEEYSASLKQSSSHRQSIAQTQFANHDKSQSLNGVFPSNTTLRTNPPCDMSLSIRHAAATSIPHRGPPSGKTALADEAAKRASVKAVRGVVLPRHVRCWSLYDLRMHWHELDVDLRRQIDLSVKDRDVAWPPHTRASDDEIKAARRLRDASAIYPYAFKKDSERSRGGPFPEYCHLWPELAEKKSINTAGERSSQAQASAGTSSHAQSQRSSHGALSFTAANGPKRSKDASKHHSRGAVGSTINVATNQAAGQAAPRHAMIHGLQSSAGDASTSPDESQSDLLRTRTAEANRHVVSSIERDEQPSSTQSQVSPRKGKGRVHDTSAHIYVAVPAPSQSHKSPRKDTSKALDAIANERDEVPSPKSSHKNKGNAGGVTSDESDELPASPQKPKSPRKSKNKFRVVTKESSPLREPRTDPAETRMLSHVQLDEAYISSKTPKSPRKHRDAAEKHAEMSLPSPATSISKPGRPWLALPPPEGSKRINERNLVDGRTSTLSDSDYTLLQSRRCQTVPPPTNKVVWFQRVTAMTSNSLALKSRTVGPVNSTVVAATNAQSSTVVQEQDTQTAVKDPVLCSERKDRSEEERAKLYKKYEKLQSKIRKISERSRSSSKAKNRERKDKLRSYKQEARSLEDALKITSDDDSSSESDSSSDSDTSSDSDAEESDDELDNEQAEVASKPTSHHVRAKSHSRRPSKSLNASPNSQVSPDVVEPGIPNKNAVHEAETDVIAVVSNGKGVKRKQGELERPEPSKQRRTHDPSVPDVGSTMTAAPNTGGLATNPDATIAAGLPPKPKTSTARGPGTSASQFQSLPDPDRAHLQHLKKTMQGCQEAHGAARRAVSGQAPHGATFPSGRMGQLYKAMRESQEDYNVARRAAIRKAAVLRSTISNSTASAPPPTMPTTPIPRFQTTQPKSVVTKNQRKNQSRDGQLPPSSEGQPRSNDRVPEDPALQLLGQFLPAGASARQRAEAAARLYQSLASQLPE